MCQVCKALFGGQGWKENSSQSFWDPHRHHCPVAGKLYLFPTVDMRGGLQEALNLHHYLPSQARKFNIIPTLTAIGSGVGIFGVVCPLLTLIVYCFCGCLCKHTKVSLNLFQATVVCDLVLLYLLPKREFYKNMKFKYTDTQAQVSYTLVVNIILHTAFISLTTAGPQGSFFSRCSALSTAARFSSPPHLPPRWP